jgi:uncharacterized protein YlxP (DUF503 family)
VVTVVMRLRLEIGGANSLKDKRRILKSLLTKLRHEFNVSIAETGRNDIIRQAEVGAAVVANESSFAHQVLDAILRKIENHHYVHLAEVSKESY